MGAQQLLLGAGAAGDTKYFNESFSIDPYMGTKFDFSNSSVTMPNVSSYDRTGPLGGPCFDFQSSYIESTHSGSDINDWDLSSGDWTLEAYYWQSSQPGYAGIVGVWPSNGGSSNNQWVLETVSNNIYFYQRKTDSSYPSLDMGVSPTNRWNHVVVSCESGTIRGWLNGNLSGYTMTNGMGSFPNSKVSFGGNIAGGGNFTGQISNIRLIKGQAIYTGSGGNLTVPRTKLTTTSQGATASNVKFLGFQAEGRPDTSNLYDATQATVMMNDSSIVGLQASGTVQGMTGGPMSGYTYNGTTPWNTTGRYGYFASSHGVYLTVSDGEDTFRFQNRDFTIEWWMNPDTNSTSGSGGYNTIYDFNASQGTGNDAWITIHHKNYGITVGWDSAVQMDCSSGIYAGRWQHCCLVREDDIFVLYIDGVCAVTPKVQKKQFDDNLTRDVHIGSQVGFSRSFYGKLSNLAVHGRRAKYSTLFKPSNENLSSVTGTTLLCCQNASDVTAATTIASGSITNNNGVTAGSVRPTAKLLKENGGSRSGYYRYGQKPRFAFPSLTAGHSFNGSNEWLSIPANSAFAFGKEDFTIEAYVTTDTTSGKHYIIDFRGNAQSNNAPSLLLESNNFNIQSGNSSIMTHNMAVESGAAEDGWYHVAVTRSNTDPRTGRGMWCLWINGIPDASINRCYTHDFSSAWGISIGRRGDGAEYWNGRISNVRVVKGTALYKPFFATPNLHSDFPQFEGEWGSNTFGGYGNTDSSVEFCTLASKGGAINAFAQNIIRNGVNLDKNSEESTGGVVIMKNRNTSSPYGAWVAVGPIGPGEALFMDRPDNTAGGHWVSKFRSDGFGVKANPSNDNVNKEKDNIISYSFKNTEKFFDSFIYTGNGGGNRLLSHNLKCAPGFIVIKRYAENNISWYCWHRELGATQYLNWDNENQVQTNSGYYNGTQSASSISIGSNLNGNGHYYSCYIWAHNDNDGKFGDSGKDVIKCGSFTGNGQSDPDNGVVVTLGFQPQWIMWKQTNNNSRGWNVVDTRRGAGFYKSSWDTANRTMRIDNGDDEDFGSQSGIEPNSNGFRVFGTDNVKNENNKTYIYMAIADHNGANSKQPTNPEGVFAIDGGHVLSGQQRPQFKSNFGNAWDNEFNVDWAFVKRWSSGDDWRSTTTAISKSDLKFNKNHTIGNFANSSSGGFMDMRGGFARDNSVFSDKFAFMFKKHQGVDFRLYKGTGSVQNITHGLGQVPQLMFVKGHAGSKNWYVYTAFSDTSGSSHGNYYLNLNSHGEATASSAIWNNTMPTKNVFTVGTSADVNGSSGSGGDNMYSAWLIASANDANDNPISKVSTYDGTNATDIHVSVGFYPSFVLIKSINQAGCNWVMFDSYRGGYKNKSAGNSGTDYVRMIYWNSDSAENTGQTQGYFDGDGFNIIGSTAGGQLSSLNQKYLYWAVK